MNRQDMTETNLTRREAHLLMEGTERMLVELVEKDELAVAGDVVDVLCSVQERLPPAWVDEHYLDEHRDCVPLDDVQEAFSRVSEYAAATGHPVSVWLPDDWVLHRVNW